MNGLPLLELLDCEVPQTTKYFRLLAILFIIFPNLRVSFIQHVGLKLSFIWKLQSYWPAFIVLEGAMHDIKGEKQLSILPSYVISYNKTGQVRQAYWYKSSTNIMEVTNYNELDLRLIQKVEIHIWHHFGGKRTCIQIGGHKN